jgi:hypothetical protein
VTQGRALLVLSLLLWSPGSEACDFWMPPPGSRIRWPDGLSAAQVRVLKIDAFSNGPRKSVRAWVRLIHTFRGVLPQEFAIFTDTSSCGSALHAGEESYVGLRRHTGSKENGADAYVAYDMTDAWTRGVFVNKIYILDN